MSLRIRGRSYALGLAVYNVFLWFNPDTLLLYRYEHMCPMNLNLVNFFSLSQILILSWRRPKYTPADVPLDNSYLFQLIISFRSELVDKLAIKEKNLTSFDQTIVSVVLLQYFWALFDNTYIVSIGSPHRLVNFILPSHRIPNYSELNISSNLCVNL